MRSMASHGEEDQNQSLELDVETLNKTKTPTKIKHGPKLKTKQ